MRRNNLIFLGILVAIFLTIRTWLDRTREKTFDMELVREGEEYLGQWSGRTADTFVHIRLKRDGSFISKSVRNGYADTIHTNGKYEIVDGQAAGYYPRLLTI